MLKKYLFIIFSVLTVTLTCGFVPNASAQAVTVIEYYNKPLDAYFITGRATEQQTVEANTDFQRTGMTFQAVASGAATTATTRICRFYVSTSAPFTSSHYYGREGTDCESLLAQNLTGFSYEGFDFALAQPSSGVCPVNTTPIYRSFRAPANGKTANHRYTASAASYAAATNAGYVGEQAAFCTTAATDITPVVQADCGTFYYPGIRVSYQSLTDKGVPNSWLRLDTGTKTTFNGVEATVVVDRYTGLIAKILIGDATDTWSDLGTSTQDETGMGLDTFFNPPTVYPRRMTVGQQIDVSRATVYDPGQPSGSASVNGYIRFVGRESVTVGAGTYTACKFTSEITSALATVSRTSVARTTTWVAPDVGIVKSSTSENITVGTSTTTSTTEVTAVAVQKL
jgi:hypothetical protein